MKKSLLLAFALLLSSAIFAQNRAIHLRETFDSTELPEGWTVSDTGSDNWKISETNNAGGEANELMLSSTPQAAGITRIITKPIDLTGMSSVTVSFRHYFKKKSTSCILGVATSANGSTWSSAWTHTYSEDGQYTVIENVTTPDMGKQNVMFCIYYQGSTGNMNGWYFDDFEIVTIENNDGKVESIDMHDVVVSGKIGINFTVQNTGANDITSFEAKYEVNGVTVTESFDADIAKFGTQKFTFDEKVYLEPGSYNVKVSITSVNGGDDENTTNNSLTKALGVAVGGTQRVPMFEQFSSSTCANCGLLNGNMSILTANNPGKYTYTKYAMNFPSPGDDYYTADAGTRSDYYNVSYVPQLFFDGKDNEYNAVTQEQLDTRCDVPAFVNIKGAFNLEGSTINVIVDVMSFINLSDAKIFVTANEKTTVNNVEYNGETEFRHIMMKMLSGVHGETFDLNEFGVKRFEYSYDMSQTFVEELSDLEVSVWIQNYQTKEVYNSHFMYEYTSHPYPAQNLKLEKGDKINVSWEAPEQGTPVAYNLIVNNEIVMEETTEMSYTIDDADGYYAVEVVALYEDGKESVGIFDRIGQTSIVENEISFGIYPNPVDSHLYLNINDEVKEINIYNILGVQVYQTTNYNGNSINVNELNNGMYLIKVTTANSESVKRFIKK